MGREQMRNLDTSRIGGAQVNEFEYQKNQGELTEQLEQHPSGTRGATPLTQAERVKAIMAAAHKKVQKRKKKEAAATGKKKSTAKAASKSRSTAKASTKSGSSTKAASKSSKKAAGKTGRKK